MSKKQTIKDIIANTYYNLYRKHQNIIGNRVVLYHSIGSKLKHDTYGISISKKQFIEHIKYIKDNHEVISIDEAYKNNLDRNTISLTFDDGYKDNLIALEICEKYDIPFSLYITTGEIGKENYLDKKEILEFAKSDKCILGSHSHTHPLLATLSYEDQYHELEISKKILEDITGASIVGMSYPHGSYNQDTLKIARELGYRIVTSSNIGINSKNNIHPLEVKRIEIVATDDIHFLRKKILGYYDYLAWKA